MSLAHVPVVLLFLGAALFRPTSVRAQESARSVRFTTTESLQDCTIAKYLGVVIATPRIGGDRAPSQKGLTEAYGAATKELAEKAAALGANWIVKLEFAVAYGYDRDGTATGHFPQALTAVGTAVQATCP